MMALMLLYRRQALFHYQLVYDPHAKAVKTFMLPPELERGSRPLGVWFGPAVGTELTYPFSP
jgi:hypothetical protein